MNDILKDLHLLVDKSKQDPLFFINELLLVGDIEEWQKDALKSICVGSCKIAIKSGHGVGKTTLLCWLILWWLFVNKEAKVAITASGYNQLENVLMSDIKKWLAHSHPFIKGLYEVLNDRIKFLPSPDKVAVIRASGADKPEALQGFHSENMLFIIDEASGVADVVFDVAMGTLSTTNATLVLTGNPTKNTGYFYSIFANDLAGWIKKTVSCYESKRVSRTWIEEMKAEHGEESDFFKVRVLGQFPSTSDMQLYSEELVDKSFRYTLPAQDFLPLVIGVDVARQGKDLSIICLRQGRKVITLDKYRIADTMALADKIALYIKKHNPIGVVLDGYNAGVGVYDRLRQLGYGDIVSCCLVGLPSSEPKLFFNKKAELYYKLKQEMLSGLSLVNDRDLKKELLSINSYHDDKGRLRIEGKEELAKSPDMVDALILTYAFNFRNDLTIKQNFYKSDYSNVQYG
jgi:phage terminase large subunit